MIDRTRAERQRRYRQRQKLGLRVFCIELNDADIERLIDAGLLKECDALDDQNIASALVALVKSLDGDKRQAECLSPMSAFPTISSALPPLTDIIRVRQYVRS